MADATALTNLCNRPTPTEKTAQNFITMLTLLYAGRNEAAEAYRKAIANLTAAKSSEETALARTALTAAEVNLQNKDAEVENNLKDEFKKFVTKTIEISNTNTEKSGPVFSVFKKLFGGTTKISRSDAEQFSEAFFRKINSSRLQSMRHVAMIILENLEQLHEAAASGVHANKALFNEYREKIWGIRLELTDASTNEIILKKLLEEFLEKTDHQITIQLGGRDLIHLEPSIEEDQRLRLLSSASNYLHSLNGLKGTLTSLHAPKIDPIIAEVKAGMQAVLAEKLNSHADKQKIVQLRAEIETKALDWEKAIDQIIQENKQTLTQQTTASTVTATPLRAPGNSSMLEEARKRDQLVADQQKILASIFKPPAPKL